MGTMAKALLLACLAPFILAAPMPAYAQPAYPVKPIRLVVPFPPGASNDVLARTLGDKLREAWAQPVVVDNRAGAGGAIGAQAVATASPDGYTFMFTSVSYTTYVAAQPKLPFNPAEIAGVAMVGTAPTLLVVHPALPAKSLKDLLALARAQPGRLNYASNGGGTLPHLLIEMLLRDAQISMVHVPYKGLAAAMTDLVSGQVQVLIASPPSVYPQVKAGRLRALAVSSEKRSAFVPDLPTIAESGVPGYTAQQWWGIFTRAGTPKEIVERASGEIVRILGTDDVKRRLAAEGAEPAPLSAREFDVFVKNEIVKWTKLVRERKIVAE